MAATEYDNDIENQIIPDPRRDQYPLCIVWSPIPLLSWLFPCIGHLGIVTSEGIIHDFAGPYTVNVRSIPHVFVRLSEAQIPKDLDNLCLIESLGHEFFHVNVKRDPRETAFGSVTKYWSIDLSEIKNLGNFSTRVEAWDFAIDSSSRAFEKMNHNLICNNCHDHVARALNTLEFRGRKRWNTFLLILYMIKYSRFVSFWRWLKTYAGFFALLVFIMIFFLIMK